MKEQQKQLNILKEKVSDTWKLLDVDALIAQMHGHEKEMQQEDFWSDQENAKLVSKQHEELKKETDTWTSMRDEIDELISLSADLDENPDEEMHKELSSKISDLQSQFENLEFYLLLDGKHDRKNAIVTFQAGSGGTEAQDWSEMLLRMIVRYCEKKDWETTLLEESRGSEAGIKSATLRVSGRWAYGHLKSEHGTHRLVRISPFDAEKMRHTSFALIEVIPEIEHEEFSIDEKDLRIDTFMSSGKGGQSVNTTYSAVRIVHTPTGTTVSCQNEKSQLQNKQTAMKILASRLQKLQEEKEEEERLKLRGEYKSPEWGSQIRSYVLHPYKMVKDVRTKFEVKDPDAVLDGDLDAFIEHFLKWTKKKNKE